MTDTHLHIDRVVVTGVSRVHGHEAALQDAVAAELTRLVREGGLPAGLGDASRIAPSVRVGTVTEARALGSDVAAAVYRSLATNSETRRSRATVTHSGVHAQASDPR